MTERKHKRYGNRSIADRADDGFINIVRAVGSVFRSTDAKDGEAPDEEAPSATEDDSAARAPAPEPPRAKRMAPRVDAGEALLSPRARRVAAEQEPAPAPRARRVAV